MTNVSRLTSDGKLVLGDKPACVNCGRRPQRWSGGRWQSYCKVCHSEYLRTYRAGQRAGGRVITMQLTADERELILELRRVEPTGRHHVPAN